MVALRYLYCGCLCSIFLPLGDVSKPVIMTFPSYTHLLCINEENVIFFYKIQTRLPALRWTKQCPF